MSATANTHQFGGNGRTGGLIYTGAGAPTKDNDASNGYHVGDTWLDTTNFRVYDCIAEAAAAAVWLSNTWFNQIAASSAITASSTETPFDQAPAVFPANLLKVGTRIKFRGQVIATATNSTDTLTIKVKLGSTVIFNSGALDVANNDISYFDGEITVRDIGATGHIVANGIGTIGTEGTSTDKAFKLASTAIDTTATQALTVTAQWSTTNAGNSCRSDGLTVEVK